MIEKLIQNPVTTVVSVLFTITSVVLAIVFYLKSRREKKASYTLAARTLIDSAAKVVDGLSLLYQGQASERITVTNLGIWNAGTEALRTQDVATADPLTLEVTAPRGQVALTMK